MRLAVVSDSAKTMKQLMNGVKKMWRSVISASKGFWRMYCLSLKGDGVLIYSTCSYSKAEDEEICDWLLKNYPLSTINYQLKKDWKIVETKSSQHNAYGYRFYPDKVKGEGFFIAAFKKNGYASIKVQVPRSIEIKQKNYLLKK